MIPGIVTGICVNHHCSRFEYVVPAHEGATCDTCGHRLLAPNGVDYPGETDHPLAATLRADEGALD